MNDVLVISGSSDGCFPVAGKTVGAVRKHFVDALAIPGSASGFINGDLALEDTILGHDDVLEFIVPAGRKGALDPEELAILGRIEDRMDQLSETPARFQRVQLNEKEQNIFEALGDGVLRGETLAEKSGYPYGTSFRETLSALVRHGLLERVATGYQVPDDVRSIVLSRL